MSTPAARGVRVVGPPNPRSSYRVLARGFSQAMPGHIRQATTPLQAKAAVHFMMPHEVRALSGEFTANFTMFEAQPPPASWLAAVAACDLLIVPSDWDAANWTAAGHTGERIAVCPLAVDGGYWSAPASEPCTLDVAGRPLASYRARFLNVAELRPRKNHLGLLQVWLQATDASDDAVLIIKTTATLKQFSALLAAASALRIGGKSLRQAAPVHFVNQGLSADALRGLYQACSHYVSLSRGEGWDLPMMEAGAAGLALVGPDHTGYRAHLRAADCDLLPARLMPVVESQITGADDAVWFRGAHWHEPDTEAAVSIVKRHIHASTDRPGPQARILRDFTWAHAVRRLHDIVGQHLNKPGAT